MTKSEFSERSCPLCTSSRNKVFLSIDADAIFQGNWSYRQSEKSALQIAKDMTFPIVECGDCNFIYAKYLPSSEFLHVVYDRVIDDVAAKASSFSLASMTYRMDYLTALMRLLPDDQKALAVLDYGCGFGPTLRLLKALPSIRAIGYENSLLRIKELTTENFNVTNDVADVSEAAPFAAIIMDNVLEHIPDPFETLVQIRQWMNAETILYISVPEANVKFMRHQLKLSKQGKAIAMDVNPWEHLNYFDLVHLDALLLKAGFMPLTQAELPVDVSVGLRPCRDFRSRFKNALASMLRVAAYIRTGNALCTTTTRYYRLAES